MSTPAEDAARSPLAVLGAIVLASAIALAVGHRLGDRTGLAPGERVLGARSAGPDDGVRYGRDALDEEGEEGGANGGGAGGGAEGGEGSGGEGAGGGRGEERAGAGGGAEGERRGAGAGAGLGAGAGAGARAGGAGVGGGGTGAGSEAASPTVAAVRAPPPTATAAPAPPEDPPAVIAGKVVDPDGAGVAAASVRVLSGSRTYHDVKTGGDGGFRIEKVRPGRYRLVVRAGGFMDLAVPGSVSLASSETRVLDDIALRRAGRIAGRVTDPEGAPVARAHVAAEKGGAFGRYETRTRGDGSFELYGFPAGKSRIRATHDDFLPSAWATVEVPKLEDGTAGAVEGVTLALRPGGAIEGTITGPDGAGVNIGVGLFDARGRRVERMGSKAGAYRFEGLNAGTYQVATDALAGAIAREDVTIAAGEHRRLDLALAGGGVLTGVCQDEKGEPVKDVKVTAAAQGIASSPAATSGADGRFRIEGLFDAAYVVTARPPERFAVPDPLSVAIAAAAGPQEVAFQLDAGATIAGRATAVDGGPAGGARVVVHERASGARLAAVDADPAGRFRIPRLPPVEVEVYVASGQELARELRRLAAAEETQLDVLLQPAAKIRGTVVRADGTPAGGATVEGVSDGGVVRRSVKSGGGAASFELGTLYPGRYTVTATLAGASAAPADISVGPGQVVEGVVLQVR